MIHAIFGPIILHLLNHYLGMISSFAAINFCFLHSTIVYIPVLPVLSARRFQFPTASSSIADRTIRQLAAAADANGCSERSMSHPTRFGWPDMMTPTRYLGMENGEARYKACHTSV
jgi:hypothetical protein